MPDAERIRIYENVDCMEGMEKYKNLLLSRKTLAIVDPQYGNKASKPSKKPSVVLQKNGKYLPIKSNKYVAKEWDYTKMPFEYFHKLKYVSKNQIIWGENYYGILGGGRIVWDKLNGESDQFGCEIAYCSLNSRTDIVYFMWQGMFQGIYCGKDVRQALTQQGDKSLNEERIHPTQKPISLYKWLLENYSKKHDLILDTHVGSGSSLIACEEFGIDYVGFELDPDYYRDSKARIEKARFEREAKKSPECYVNDLSLFGGQNA